MMRLLAIALLWLATALARPVGPAPESVATIPGVQPELAVPDDAHVQELARHIGLKLRCPVCQGLSTADSTSPAAVQMQRLVRDLVAQGYSEDQIEAYFTSRYGEWILLEPPSGGLDNLVWLGPLGLGLIGLSVIIGLMGRARTPTASPTPHPPAPPQDEYARQLLDEVDE